MGKALSRLRGTFAALRTAWSSVGITLVILLVVDLGFRALFSVRDRLTAAPALDRRIIAQGYAGAMWPIQHFRELEQLQERWQPFAYFRQTPFPGATINIGVDGLRATWQDPEFRRSQGGAQAVRILMLGGSSLWGFGARDDQTIPSLLVRSLLEKGWHAEVRNLAEIGYVSTQEVVALARELQAGYRPDVVIFYDGVNDSTSALLEGEPGLTTNESNRRQEFNLLQSPARMGVALVARLVKDSGSYRFARRVRRWLAVDNSHDHPAPGTLKVPDAAAGVVQLYEGNVILVQALARSFGFRPLFFWQPTVFTKPDLVAVEQEEAERFAWAEAFLNNVHNQIKTSATLRSNPAFRDLGTIFDATKGLVFIDYCHTTEAANALIASEMAALVIGTRSK